MVSGAGNGNAQMSATRMRKRSFLMLFPLFGGTLSASEYWSCVVLSRCTYLYGRTSAPAFNPEYGTPRVVAVVTLVCLLLCCFSVPALSLRVATGSAEGAQRLRPRALAGYFGLCAQEQQGGQSLRCCPDRGAPLMEPIWLPGAALLSLSDSTLFRATFCPGPTVG